MGDGKMLKISEGASRMQGERTRSWLDSVRKGKKSEYENAGNESKGVTRWEDDLDGRVGWQQLRIGVWTVERFGQRRR